MSTSAVPSNRDWHPQLTTAMGSIFSTDFSPMIAVIRQKEEDWKCETESISHLKVEKSGKGGKEEVGLSWVDRRRRASPCPLEPFEQTQKSKLESALFHPIFSVDINRRIKWLDLMGPGHSEGWRAWLEGIWAHKVDPQHRAVVWQGGFVPLQRVCDLSLSLVTYSMSMLDFPAGCPFSCQWGLSEWPWILYSVLYSVCMVESQPGKGKIFSRGPVTIIHRCILNQISTRGSAWREPELLHAALIPRTTLDCGALLNTR